VEQVQKLSGLGAWAESVVFNRYRVFTSHLGTWRCSKILPAHLMLVYELRAWWEGGCCSLENVEHLKNSFQDRSGLSTPQESRTAASPSKPDKHYHCYATFIDSFPGIRRHLPRHSIKAPPLCKHLLLLLLDARLGFLS